ncbi:hypothetical protein NQ315_005913 [Exocentrus adspersus]|uniref:Uncharacterized protein n=1 Tax=Exocentrus adspersus TaxID=1586481 RepID=A0AAV8V998_9CUCU|nr:hypothetical protein NQ315_005913 [Exocentrus adspersus]
MYLFISEVNNSKIAVQEKNGLFDIKAVAEIPSLETPEEFSCELHIPQANYTVRKEAIYYPEYDGIRNINLVALTLEHLAEFIIYLNKYYK